MKPIYLYIENFMCHEISELDLSLFSSVLIIGQVDNSDLHSNGVGKSTIFKAIEFCIFNESSKDFKLEFLVRDDTLKCKVVFDFHINNKIYRISRSRTKKGSADLSLYEKTSYTEIGFNPHRIFSNEDNFKKYWKDISGRRASDTEEDLQKIHLMNYKSFCSGYYFAQDDYNTGLATATKSGRKELLKSSLQVVVYNHLFKLTSIRATSLLKEIDKKKVILETIGNPLIDITSLELKSQEFIKIINNQQNLINILSKNVSDLNLNIALLTNQSKDLENQLSSFDKKREEVANKFKRTENHIHDYTNKRKAIITAAKQLTVDLNSLKENKLKLIDLDFSKIETLYQELNLIKEDISFKSGLINSLKESLIELRIPFPNEKICKHCRQLLTDIHRKECEKSNNEEIRKKEEKIKELLIEKSALTIFFNTLTENISKLELAKKQIDLITNQIIAKNKELTDKKSLCTDYESILNKQKIEFEEIKIELDKVKQETEDFKSKELENLIKSISLNKNEYNKLLFKYKEEEIILTKFNNDKAVIDHSILEKKSNLQKKDILQKEFKDLNDKYSSLPDVLEAFGPTGIPNLIIQNVLSNLQDEANLILNQIRPGLQLSFLIEKTKGDGELDDDLDIEYFLNGKQRHYSQLSGAQKLCVTFSLKLGVAYLLKKTLGATMQMLLLDEIDPALDKASVDAFADIIKFFQKDFTILVITHNDRLKNKFSHVILVEQNQNMISKAKVVSSW